jgi:hypothetical protein
MRLPRIKITAHYNALNREVPDGVSILGAIISTYVGRPLAAAVIQWLRVKSVTKYRKGYPHD